MENLGYLLKFTLFIRCALESGESIRGATIRFLDNTWEQEHEKIKIWFVRLDRLQTSNTTDFKRNEYVILLDLLAEGMGGVSIYERLCSYQEELLDICREDLQKKLDRLPYEMMIPLLLFMFPAVLLLILGPILLELKDKL